MSEQVSPRPALLDQSGGLWKGLKRHFGTRQRLPLMTTLAVAIVLYTAASFYFRNFFAVSVFVNFFVNNAVMGIVAVGMTFVILMGGIDLSVSSVVACGSVILAKLIMDAHMAPVPAILLVVAGATLGGAFMGSLIHFFEIPAFLVTLGGLFFYRGLGLIISEERVSVQGVPLMDFLGRSTPITLGSAHFYVTTPFFLFLIVFFIALYVAHLTAFGRNVYAVGGNETSALLMGLPVSWTKISTYAISGFCGGLGAVAQTLADKAGNSNGAMGLELEAIATVVVGGTLLTGGVGQVTGTLLGVFIFGLIRTSINFIGTLSPSWREIAVGILLLVFVLLQKILQPRRQME